MKKKNRLLPALLTILVIGLVIGFLLGRSNPPQQGAAQPAADPGSAQLTLLEPTAGPTATPQPTAEPAGTPAPEPSESTAPTQAPAGVTEDGKYDTKDEVALYIHSFGHLPSNFVTKSTARKAGWSSGSLEKYFPGCSIGGDVFQNREGLLPEAPGRTYFECDIEATGQKTRGAKRIVFSSDGLIYYTDDHYDSFTLLYGEAPT